MIGLIAAGAAIVGVWTIFLGTAALCRRQFLLSRGASAALVVSCYSSLAAVAVVVLGTGWPGRAGAIGMLLPCAVAFVIVFFD